jgi:hypothetical protein
MAVTELTKEHIDPRKGVLVSGLENDFNEVIADWTYNARKVNRFVPFRCVGDEPWPVTFGDFSYFLIGEEWVYCEFGGPEWWEESNRVGNSQVSGGKNSKSTEVRRAQGKKLVRDQVGLWDPAQKDKVLEGSRAGGRKGGKKGGAIVGKKYGGSNRKAILCVETGVVYASSHEAGEKTGLAYQNIGACCRGTQETAGGCHWQFAEGSAG